MERSIFIGFDPREANAYAVTKQSIHAHCNVPYPVRPVIMQDLIEEDLYYRETIRQDGRLFDVISEHPMATEFAISRFLTPLLAKREPRSLRGVGPRLAVFMDSDMLVRRNIDGLFASYDGHSAVQVVKHNFAPAEGLKMDGQVQSRYGRKNWSSVMLFNIDHPANNELTVELINSVPGRDLHAFCWLHDYDIGELPVDWNYLIGHHTRDDCVNPSLVHFTDGIPTMPGYENAEYAEEWNATLRSWARSAR
jgi:hypothetical protein